MKTIANVAATAANDPPIPVYQRAGDPIMTSIKHHQRGLRALLHGTRLRLAASIAFVAATLTVNAQMALAADGPTPKPTLNNGGSIIEGGTPAPEVVNPVKNMAATGLIVFGVIFFFLMLGGFAVIAFSDADKRGKRMVLAGLIGMVCTLGPGIVLKIAQNGGSSIAG